MSEKKTILTVAIGFVILSGVLAYTSNRLGQERRAWTSHHTELVVMIHHCPGQHASVRMALEDGALQLGEARNLISACAAEILRGVVNPG